MHRNLHVKFCAQFVVYLSSFTISLFRFYSCCRAYHLLHITTFFRISGAPIYIREMCAHSQSNLNKMQIGYDARRWLPDVRELSQLQTPSTHIARCAVAVHWNDCGVLAALRDLAFCAVIIWPRGDAKSVLLWRRRWRLIDRRIIA